jgi:DNA-3-methyladenine glycosylase
MPMEQRGGRSARLEPGRWRGEDQLGGCWHDAIRKMGTRHEKRAFEPGTSFDDQPSSVTTARNTQPRPNLTGPVRLRSRCMPRPPTSTQPSQISPLDRGFFIRDPRRVARQLLGKVLIRRGRARLTARIVEVEAYLGEEDPAAHSAAGNTARTAVLFGPPGHAYVYFIYGNHYCLNVSCEPEGLAGSVLFRALEPLSGTKEMADSRGIEVHNPKDLVKLTSGPGRLCEAFGITRPRDNGCDLTSAASSLWIGDDGYRARGIQVTPRIGITKAADKPLRYFLDGNPFVSRKIRLQ